MFDQSLNAVTLEYGNVKLIINRYFFIYYVGSEADSLEKKRSIFKIGNLH